MIFDWFWYFTALSRTRITVKIRNLLRRPKLNQMTFGVSSVEKHHHQLLKISYWRPKNFLVVLDTFGSSLGVNWSTDWSNFTRDYPCTSWALYRQKIWYKCPNNEPNLLGWKRWQNLSINEVRNFQVIGTDMQTATVLECNKSWPNLITELIRLIWGSPSKEIYFIIPKKSFSKLLCKTLRLRDNIDRRQHVYNFDK